jgi:hypothetical protein
MNMTTPDGYPSRIVCLTEETTETLYLLEEDWRIVGISGFTVRPPRARREKPKVSAFISAKVDRIRDLRPDLVLGFSDLQADIAAQLVRLGLNVFVFNHRDVAGILQMIRVLGGMIGCEAKAVALAARLEQGLDEVRATAARFERRPRVYFEEWDEPMISGIRWVSELIGIAGGEDCFADNARRTSSSAHGAARSFVRNRWRRVRVGNGCRQWHSVSCTRSSHRSSCSRGRQHSPRACRRCRKSCTRGRGVRCRSGFSPTLPHARIVGLKPDLQFIIRA